MLAHWKTSGDLGFTTVEAAEWDLFCKHLVNSGILLTDRVDTLIWNGGDNSGILTAKNAYDTLATNMWIRSTSWWHRTLWDQDLALKIKLFSWLMMEGKILTWDNLQRRGWVGPSVCCLC
jgi:hypothetical protein